MGQEKYIGNFENHKTRNDKTGDLVEIDSDRGMIKILKRNDSKN